jgi:hypothetical protein
MMMIDGLRYLTTHACLANNFLNTHGERMQARERYECYKSTD